MVEQGSYPKINIQSAIISVPGYKAVCKVSAASFRTVASIEEDMVEPAGDSLELRLFTLVILRLELVHQGRDVNIQPENILW